MHKVGIILSVWEQGEEIKINEICKRLRELGYGWSMRHISNYVRNSMQYQYVVRVDTSPTKSGVWRRL